MMMKKIFYHKFIPSKEEEEEEAEEIHSNNPEASRQFQPTKVLVETQDWYPPFPIIDMRNPWKIRKTLSPHEVAAGRIFVSFNNTFELVFRYWELEMANLVLTGRKVGVDLWDVTDGNLYMHHCDNTAYFEICNSSLVPRKLSPQENYCLVAWDLFRRRGLTVGDEIGLYWDHRTSAFYFTLLGRHLIIQL